MSASIRSKSRSDHFPVATSMGPRWGTSKRPTVFTNCTSTAAPARFQFLLRAVQLGQHLGQDSHVERSPQGLWRVAGLGGGEVHEAGDFVRDAVTEVTVRLR